MTVTAERPRARAQVPTAFLNALLAHVRKLRRDGEPALEGTAQDIAKQFISADDRDAGFEVDDLARVVTQATKLPKEDATGGFWSMYFVYLDEKKGVVIIHAAPSPLDYLQR